MDPELEWKHSKECMCRLHNIGKCDYQEMLLLNRQTAARQSDPYVPL